MTTFNNTNSVVSYTVSYSGFYDIFSAGAQGGGAQSNSSLGGHGASVDALIYLGAGTVLNLVVGGVGGTDLYGGGGGGGSFVYTAAGVLLEAAGGGGGAGYARDPGGTALATVYGQDGSGAAGGSAGHGGLAGQGGQGGQTSSGYNGGGGAGWLSAGSIGVGGTGVSSSGLGGASNPIFAGGSGHPGSPVYGGDGGFGGGGGGSYDGGGGGGGYSGGGGGAGNNGIGNNHGGGGGSYIIGSAMNAVVTGNANVGNGQIILSLVFPDVSSSFYIGGYNASSQLVNGASSYSNAGNFLNTNDTTAAVQLDSSLVGTLGSLSNLITVSKLVGLNSQSAITSTTFANTDVLPSQTLDAALIGSIMVKQGVTTNQVNYLFATDFTGHGKLAVSNTAHTNFDDVLVANSPENAGGVTLDLTTFKGIAITGDGVNVTGMTAANEVIGAGNATYTMGAGNETMVLNGHNAQVVGGSGTDTVVLQGSTIAGSSINYVDANQVQVWSDSNSAGSGVNTLTGVERIQFTDGTVALDTASNQNAGEAYLLYGVFNRTADQAGLGYWINQLDKGVSAQTAAANFISSSEFQASLGTNISATAFISALYQNVLHRTADAAGLAYWNGQLQGADNVANRATMLESFAFSSEHVALVGSQMTHGVVYQAYTG